MNNVVLKVENVSKKYRLGSTGSGSMSEDLMRWWYKIRGKEDPYAAIGVVNDRTVEGGEFVWALKDINIEVKEGEILGIIGKNGAGKSTLLKLLSKITAPTIGSIKIKGRMASLLEVGTGFHPELTGRQNIYLNGIILGMSKEEISNKMEEIVEFSGCAKYLDTPAKRYSTGMRVRLGFAVAAFLEPDIMIVDEVLAVGDAEFQKQAIKKMKDVTSESGRTVLFVSHNMSSIKSLCTRVIVLKEGAVIFDGDVEEGVQEYLGITEQQEGVGEMKFNDVNNIAYAKSIRNIKNVVNYIDSNYLFEMIFHIVEPVVDLFILIKVEDSKGQWLIMSSTDELETNPLRFLKSGNDYKLNFSFNGRMLKPGIYYITFTLRGYEGDPYHKVERAITFEIQDNDTFRGMKNRYRTAAIMAPEMDFKIVDVK